MKLKDRRAPSLFDIKTNVKKRPLIYLLIIVSVFLVGFILGIPYGIRLYRSGKAKIIGINMVNSINHSNRIVGEYLNSQSAYIDEIIIDIKFLDLEKLRFQRDKAFNKGYMSDREQKPVNAKVKFKSETYKVEISLTGQNVDHFGDPEKWSYDIKVKGGRTIKGMRKFKLLVPHARGYLTDWIGTTLSKSRSLIGLRQDFVDVVVNGSNMGIYYLEEKFDKILIESNGKKEGIIFRLVDNEITPYQKSRVINNYELNSQLILLKKLWKAYLTNQIGAQNIFDLKKMASLAAITDLLRSKHGQMAGNQRFYFNPITNLVEPIQMESGYLFDTSKDFGIIPYDLPEALHIDRNNKNARYYEEIDKSLVWRRLNENMLFLEHYVHEALILSDKDYLDSILNYNGMATYMHKKVQMDNPFYVFPLEQLYNTQRYISNRLLTDIPPIDTYFKYIKNDTLYICIDNNSDLPVEIHFVKYNRRADLRVSSRLILKQNFQDEYTCQEVGFILNKSIDTSLLSHDSLEVYYSILGTNKLGSSIVGSKKMTSDDFLALNPAMRTSNISEFDFLIIDESNKDIIFSELVCNITKDLILPKGYLIKAIPGCKINLRNSAHIISYSPLLFYGNTDSIISFTSSDFTGQGIVVFNCEQTSILSYVNFTNLSSVSASGWSLRGAISFYESPIDIANCNFSNNIRGDDYLNIIRTNFTIVNTSFNFTKADALDSDYCKGAIKNVKFNQIGNDGIDVSGTRLFIDQVEIINPGDKGISGGEGSNIIGKEIFISGGQIAIASKDNTLIKVDGLKIYNSKLSFVAFQKKPEYGPGVIIATKFVSDGFGKEYLVEHGSSLSINGNKIKNKNQEVKEMLYGKEFGKSSK
jgi:hypothetical protein